MKRTSRRTDWKIATAIILIDLIVAAAIFASGSRGYTDYGEGIRPGGLTVRSPSVVEVAFVVENIGTAIGTPYCLISLTSANGHSTGLTGVLLPRPIPVKKFEAYSARVVMPNRSAGDVTKAGSSLSCR